MIKYYSETFWHRLETKIKYLIDIDVYNLLKIQNYWTFTI